MSTAQEPQRILVVDDEANIRRVLSVLLKHEQYEVEVAATGAECLQKLDEAPYDLVISDVRMSGMDGFSLLKRIKARNGSPAVILMTAFGTTETAIEAIKAGADDYFSKPVKSQEMIHRVKKVLHERGLESENARLRKGPADRDSFQGIIGQSPGMRAIYEKIQKVAAFKSTVLITGESGTGKELVAKALHQLSPRANGPFIAVNCGALPKELVESELFGHAKGAFTGAHQDKVGLFEQAKGGTLFLDEIGDLDGASQVKLLRALQENEIRPVGSNRTVKMDVRLVTATERDLTGLVAQGQFRESLYYRLNVVPIALPPLRERKEDIPLLARHFVQRFAEQMEMAEVQLSNRIIERLLHHDWPGNVRELENVLERAVVMSNGQELNEEVLPSAGPVFTAGGVTVVIPEELISLKDVMRAVTEMVEREMIGRALRLVEGNRTKAADVLGISQRSLLYKLKEYGVE